MWAILDNSCSSLLFYMPYEVDILVWNTNTDFDLGHPSCLDMTMELVSMIKTYPWQCMECKTCIVCGQPHHEEEMMFCDVCDRGYHTFCVGLGAIPSGKDLSVAWWACRSCSDRTRVSQALPTCFFIPTYPAVTSYWLRVSWYFPWKYLKTVHFKTLILFS